MKTKNSNYNYYVLFRSMMNFVVKATKTLNRQLHDNCVLFKNKQEEKEWIEKFVEQAHNTEHTVEQILCDISISVNTLTAIIATDNVEMFRICLCNMSNQTHNFDINTQKKYFYDLRWQHVFSPTNDLRWQQQKNQSQVPVNIISLAVKQNATKIVSFLLGSFDGSYDCNHNYNYDDNHHDNNIINAKNNYKNININGNIFCNFPNIDLNVEINNGETLLTFACYKKYVEIVSLIINHPNTTKKHMNQATVFDKLTPLHSVFMQPFSLIGNDSNTELPDNSVVKIAEMLINDPRTDINAVDERGNTPLIVAIQSQTMTKYASILIDNEKFDVNVQNYFGDTVIHTLIKQAIQAKMDFQFANIDCQCKSLKQLLIRKDLHLNLKNNDGKTGLDLAKKYNLKQIIDILNEK